MGSQSNIVTASRPAARHQIAAASFAACASGRDLVLMTNVRFC
jgi:hypothetical protein